MCKNVQAVLFIIIKKLEAMRSKSINSGLEKIIYDFIQWNIYASVKNESLHLYTLTWVNITYNVEKKVLQRIHMTPFKYGGRQ